MAPLSITVEGAKGLGGSGFIFKKDPYAILTVGSHKHTTKTASGANPTWSSKAEFDISGSETAEVKIYDDDTLVDDFMGSAKFDLKPGKHEVPIKGKDGKDAGIVIISVGEGGAAAGSTGGKKKKDKKEKKEGGGSSSSSSSDSD